MEVATNPLRIERVTKRECRRFVGIGIAVIFVEISENSIEQHVGVRWEDDVEDFAGR